MLAMNKNYFLKKGKKHLKTPKRILPKKILIAFVAVLEKFGYDYLFKDFFDLFNTFLSKKSSHFCG